MKESRDIRHEQVRESTDAELAERLLQIVTRSCYSRYGIRGEYHAITSEMYCRANGITSEPFITYSNLGATALRLIAAAKKLVRL